MVQTHTVKSFDEELRSLRALVSQMGGLAEYQIRMALDALMDRDIDGAAKVVAADAEIDALEREAERLAVEIIALRHPLADDLREVISALKISAALERVGDYAKNIAKRSTVLSQARHIQPLAIVPEIGRIVAQMLKDALDAYGSRDTAKALKVRDRDMDVDDLYNSLFRSLLTYMMENPQAITPSTHLMFVAKNLERIGDLSTNMAEIVYYNATGERMAGDRPKHDDTAFAHTPDASRE